MFLLSFPSQRSTKCIFFSSLNPSQIDRQTRKYLVPRASARILSLTSLEMENRNVECLMRLFAAGGAAPGSLPPLPYQGARRSLWKGRVGGASAPSSGKKKCIFLWEGCELFSILLVKDFFMNVRFTTPSSCFICQCKEITRSDNNK